MVHVLSYTRVQCDSKAYGKNAIKLMIKLTCDVVSTCRRKIPMLQDSIEKATTCIKKILQLIISVMQ